MNILIINHDVKQCGVYQYGKRVGNILEKSDKHNFVYLELNSYDQFDQNLKKYNPEFIIYNWTGGTLPWITPDTVSNLRKQNIHQFLLVHNESNYSQFFDGYLHQHPYWPEGERDFAIARPLPFYDKNQNIRNDGIIRIGSFGFGLVNKYFHEVCRVVNEQFYNQKVELRLHLTSGVFAGSNQNIDLVQQMCHQNITSPNIRLNITNDFIDDGELLDFLGGNDLNIFFYQQYPNYNGISSVIDYALAVQKPLAINKSSMYAHIVDAQPSICVEDNSLQNIIDNGFAPLQEKHDSWSNKNFIDTIEKIFEGWKRS